MILASDLFPLQFGGGREGTWHPPAWMAVLRVLEAHGGEKYTQAENPELYDDLEEALREVGASFGVRGDTEDRSLFRAAGVAWTGTGVVELGVDGILLTPLGHRVSAGEASYADALRHLVANYRSRNGKSPFVPVLSLLQQGPAGMRALFDAVQIEANHEFQAWLAMTSLRGFPYTVERNSRGVKQILAILETSGLIVNAGEDLWELGDGSAADDIIRGYAPDSAHEAEVDPTQAEAIVEELTALLLRRGSIVLEGVPGTGKTHVVRSIAERWSHAELASDGDGGHLHAMVMHPSTSYEDFVEGLRPGGAEPPSRGHRFDRVSPGASTNDFGIGSGFFKMVCRSAARNPDQDFLVLLDEFNRCNVSSVMGDLLLLLEDSKRAKPVGSDWVTTFEVTLPYSGQRFFVPDNVYVIATANTSDRSIAPIDSAIRRRFAFARLEPDFEPFANVNDMAESVGMLRDLNLGVLLPCLGPDALLGHSYAWALLERLAASEVDATLEARATWQYDVLPQLIDNLRNLGAENLLSPISRDEWFSSHPELQSHRGTADLVLSRLETFLAGLGLGLFVAGTGLSRGVRVDRYPYAAESEQAFQTDELSPPLETGGESSSMDL